MSIFLIFISLILGIAFRKSYIVIGIVYFLLALILSNRLVKHKRLSLTLLGVFLFGFGISFINISYPQKTSYVGIVYETKENYFLFNSNGEKLYCYEKNNHREIGDLLTIKGQKEDFDFATLESDFNFTSFLNNKGVYHALNIKSVKVNFTNPLRLKSFKYYFLNKFDEKTRTSVKSILFSDHDDNELTNAVSQLHLSRLINAGGLYFNALLTVLMYFFEKKIKTKWSKLLSIGAMSFYLLLTFPRFSIIRLTTIFLFKWINEYFLKKRFTYLEVVSISGIVFLLIDHHLAYQDSFVLGYSIPIYLLLVNNSFKNIKKLKKKALTLFLLYIFFIPFELKFYNSINPLLVIYQSLLTPLFIFFFFLSLICLYGIPIYQIVNFSNNILTKIVNPFTKLSISIYASPFNGYLWIVYYLFLFVALYYLSIRFRPFKKIFISTYLIGLSIYFLPIQNAITTEVTFVNVGQGDCCFIRNKYTSIFIDTGGLSYKDLASDCLIPFLKKKRVYDIDYLITTHDDFDHNGAAASLKAHFKVKKEMTNMTFTSGSYGGITLINYNNHINDGAEDNEKSLVIGFRLGKKDYLITGDASKSVESQIMKEYKTIPCDILKVGHHGSKTSTSDSFVKWLNPEIGVISVGKNNKYGHPNKEVIDVLQRNNVKIRRTDLEGTISFMTYAI